jgi:hypothetical protein
MGMPGVGLPGMAGTTMPGTNPSSTTGNWLMVPRCTLRFEKSTNGMKIHCGCDDKMACSMMQNLAGMLQGGMCSVCVQLNGLTVCTYNLTMGLCSCEMTEKGISVSCVSGDQNCCQMIQACCECLTTLSNAGCTCCVLMNNTPVCCGTSETTSQPGKTATRK